MRSLTVMFGYRDERGGRGRGGGRDSGEGSRGVVGGRGKGMRR